MVGFDSSVMEACSGQVWLDPSYIESRQTEEKFVLELNGDGGGSVDCSD